VKIRNFKLLSGDNDSGDKLSPVAFFADFLWVHGIVDTGKNRPVVRKH
jgi:hypothetical protein